MSDPEEDLGQVELAAREIVPQLAERLARHGLGELEVRHGELRVRVAATPQPAAREAGKDAGDGAHQRRAAAP